VRRPASGSGGVVTTDTSNIRYITNTWNNRVTEITITRETEKCYFVESQGCRGEIRSLKNKDYHPTREDALKYLFNKYSRTVKYLKESLVEAESNLQKINDALAAVAR
jgi:hypothetical protein